MTTYKAKIRRLNELRKELAKLQLETLNLSTTQEDLISEVPIKAPTIDENGVNVATLTENFTSAIEAITIIYNDTNLDFTQANTPQVQMAAMIAKIMNDMGVFAVNSWQSFFPSLAKGFALDNCCSINGVVRKGGTYTQLIIVLNISQPVTLRGLDNDINNPSPASSTFTVADSLGNKYFLTRTEYPSQAGEYQFFFRAQNNGYANPAPNTINSIVTAVVGVTSCNNPFAPAEVGQNTQTDPSLRRTREQSVGANGSATLKNIVAGLWQIPTVVAIKAHENPEISPVDYTGTPIHFVWIIVQGGSEEEIATTIAAQTNAGAGMRGNVEKKVTVVNGSSVNIRFDRPEEEPFYISLTIKSLDGTTDFDIPAIKSYIVRNLPSSIGNEILSSNVTTVAQLGVDSTSTSKGNVQDVMVSEDGMIYKTILQPSNLAVQFLADATKINITVVS